MTEGIRQRKKQPKLQYTDHHKDLLEPANCPHVPGRLEVDAVGVTTNQVFGQDHDEALKQNIGVLS